MVRYYEKKRKSMHNFMTVPSKERLNSGFSTPKQSWPSHAGFLGNLPHCGRQHQCVVELLGIVCREQQLDSCDASVAEIQGISADS